MDFFLIYLEVTIVNCYSHNFAFFDLILLAMTFTRLWRRFDACQIAVASWPVSRNRGLLKRQVPLFSENHASVLFVWRIDVNTLVNYRESKLRVSLTTVVARALALRSLEQSWYYFLHRNCIRVLHWYFRILGRGTLASSWAVKICGASHPCKWVVLVESSLSKSRTHLALGYALFWRFPRLYYDLQSFSK